MSNCLFFVNGCRTSQTKVKDIRIWWGNKEEIKTFLDSDNAKAKKWFIEALGE